MPNVAKMNDVLNPPWARIGADSVLHPVDDPLGGAVAAHQGRGGGTERALGVFAEVEVPSSRRAPALRYVDVRDVSHGRRKNSFAINSDHRLSLHLASEVFVVVSPMHAECP